MDRNLLQLNSPIMTKLIRDKFLPVVQVETFNNQGTLSEAFGNGSIVKQVAMPTGKLDVMFGKGRHASFGAFQDDYTFDHADGRTTGYEGVVRSRGFQSNARIDIVPNKRLNTPESFFNVFEEQFTDNAKTAKEQYSRMLYSDGSGKITKTTAAASAADLYGKTGNAFVVTFEDIRHFQIDDLVTFGSTGNVTTAEGSRKDVLGESVGPQQSGLKREQETGNGSVYEQSWNRGSTYGPGNITTMTGLITARIHDIDDEAGEVYFLFDEAYVESTGAKFALANVANIALGDVVYNRRSINGDIHGLEYMIKGSKENKAGNAELFGIGYVEKHAYGTGAGTRPAMLLSKTKTINSFLDEATYEKFMDDIELRGKDRPDLIVTTKAIRRSIASTNQGATQSIVRLMRPSTAIADNDRRSLGHGEVDLKGEVITTDRHATKGKIWFLSMPTYTMGIENEMEFDDYDGVMWKQRIVSGASAGPTKRQMSYEANMYAYREMFCTNPRGNGKINFDDAKIIKPKYKDQYATDAKDFGEKENQFGAPIAADPTESA